MEEEEEDADDDDDDYGGGGGNENGDPEEEEEEEEEEELPEAQIRRCSERVSDVVDVEDPLLKADRLTRFAEAAHSELPIESGGRSAPELACEDRDGGPGAEEMEVAAVGPHRRCRLPLHPEEAPALDDQERLPQNRLLAWRSYTSFAREK